MKRCGQMLVVSVLCALPGVMRGQTELAAIMRDEYALGLTPTVRSAGMGGAYIAVDGTFSMNPASLARASKEVALTYGYYSQDEGPGADRGRVDFTMPVPGIGGTARLMLDHLNSDGRDPTLIGDGAPMSYNSTTLGLQYGRKLTDAIAVGLGAYPYEKANVDLATPGGKMRGDGMSQLGSIQLGVLGRLHEKVNVGLQYIHIIDELEVDIPFGPEMEDDFKIDYIAAGLSAMPIEGTLVAVDYWYGDVDGDSAPGVRFDADIDRWNIGLQQRVLDGLDLRVGSNNEGLTAGFSWRMSESMSIDYAYVDEALRDKEEIFGETTQHTASLSYLF